MTELKPCPFCGGEAIVNQFGEFTAFRVSCKNAHWCGVTQYWFDTEEEAIEAWNRRVGDA